MRHQLHPHRPRRRRGRWVLAVVALLVVGWAVGSYLVIIDPQVSSPRRVDAIVVLGPGVFDGRAQVGLDLARRGLAPVLLISQPDDNYAVAQICASTPPVRVKIICFAPNPATTRGEAREIRAQAAAHGWHRIIVITSTYHISRAHMIVKRCFSGPVLMVPAQHPGFREWAYNLLYQPAAFVKAALLSGC